MLTKDNLQKFINSASTEDMKFRVKEAVVDREFVIWVIGGKYPIMEIRTVKQDDPYDEDMKSAVREKLLTSIVCEYLQKGYRITNGLLQMNSN